MSTIIREFNQKDTSNKIRIFVEYQCDECGNLHSKQKRHWKPLNFCSKPCAAALKSKSCRIDKECSFCKNKFSKKLSSLQNSKSGLFFCSRKCKDEGQKLINNIKAVWPDHYGIGDGISGYRKLALDFYGKKCTVCGFDEVKGILQVHHRDMNRLNNYVENLQVLCPNCHMTIHFTTKTGLYSPN